MPKAPATERVIAENRRARYDYFIEERIEAGLALEGWEVKSMRAGKAQLAEAYVYIRGAEAFLIGASSWSQISECLGALQKLDFSAEELRRIDQHAVDGELNIWAASSQSG